MIDDGTLQEDAREAVQAGKLPNHAPSRIWGGYGFSANCAICSNLVNSDEIGYELQFAERGGSPITAEYHVHARCFAAWDRERRRSPDRGEEGADLPAEPGSGTISASERRSYKR